MYVYCLLTNYGRFVEVGQTGVTCRNSNGIVLATRGGCYSLICFMFLVFCVTIFS